MEPSAGVAPRGDPAEGWPVDLHGVTETVIATLGPNGRWNHAALGIERADAADHGDESGAGDRAPDPDAAIARTWSRTRTRRNVTERGEGYVQFLTDPVDFVAAALGIHETDEPLLASADAWTYVSVERVGRRTESDGTEVLTWRLTPEESRVVERTVGTLRRGRAAVVEATVAASRLDVEEYEERVLLDRLDHLADVVARCGGERDRAAFARIDDLTGWRSRGE